MKRTLAALCVVLALAIGASAQFLGFTSAQSVTATPFNGTTCTAALNAGAVTVPNLGQGAHWATGVAITGSPTVLIYTIQASYDGVSFFDISDFATPLTAFGIDPVTVTGVGYYPVVAVKVTACLPALATVTIRYSGISLPPGQPVGSSLNGQINKHLAANLSAGSTFGSGTLRTPFGSSAGSLNFTFNGGSGPAGSTLTVACTTLASNASQLFTFPLQNLNGVGQSFNVPPAACPYFAAAYNPGGAGVGFYTFDYAFTPPGAGPPPYAYTHVTATTATVVKAVLGTVHTVSVNTGAVGTISLFDLSSASCTGTPATNVVAVITATATTLQTFTYDANFLSGICVKASVAMDFTVSYQ